MLFDDDDLQKEFDFLKAFVWVNSVNSLRETKARENLRILWTAFCLHHGLVPNTKKYGYYITRLWECVDNGNVDDPAWKEFSEFFWYLEKDLK